ncbi:hypothetical protein [Ornithinicoccus hortensis]|uniref:hypothetical protein n=1 Tax=Ornithinicoccus hortensis TaxID=82346 RepID=UPI00115202FF|nr:hypothetical protein [Ornithinicoccus hortensis]
MATDRLSTVLIRRWYIVALGLALTVTALALTSTPHHATYIRAQATFGLPDSRLGMEPSLPEGASLLPFAAAVGRAVSGIDTPAFVSTESPYPAVGARAGSSVRLLNTGNQWSRNFIAPTLLIETIDPIPEIAEHNLYATIDQVEQKTEQFQTETNFSAWQKIIVRIDDPEIMTLGPTRREVAKALIVTSVLGAVSTILSVRFVDRLLERKRKNACKHGA